MPPFSVDPVDHFGAKPFEDECSLVLSVDGQVMSNTDLAHRLFGIEIGDRLYLPGLNGSAHAFDQATVQVSHPNAPLASFTAGLEVSPVDWNNTSAYRVIFTRPPESQPTPDAQHASKERYRSTMDHQTNLVLRYRPDATITYANPAACHFFGKERDQLIGSSLLSLFPGECSIAAQKHLEALAENPHMAIEDQLCVSAEGETRWVQLTDQPLVSMVGEVIEFQSVGRDITEQVKSEQAVQQSEVRFREMLANAHLLAVVLNMDGSVRFANDFLLGLTGYTLNEIMQINWFEHMLLPEDTEWVRNGFRKMADSNQAIPYAQNFIRTKDGSRRLIAWNCTLLCDHTGRAVAVAGLGEDITERSWGEKAQEITYRISQGAINASNLDELYEFIHRSLSELMPTENFFIAMYDAGIDEISFPYFVDQYDDPPPPTRGARGLTDYVLRSGQPLLASPQGFDWLVESGEVVSVGTPSVDWLGVPLKVGKRVIGAMVLQTYTEGVRFCQRELQILDFVSTQIAMVIERKRSEQALRENEEKYRALVEASSAAIFLETIDGQILECNSAAVAMLGYSREELLRLTVQDLLPADQKDRIPDVLQMEQDQGGGRWEMFNRRKDGSQFPVEVNTRLVEIGGQQLSVVYVTDTTERKRREREIEAMAGVSAALRTAITQAEVLPVILQQLVDRLSVHGAFITLRDMQSDVKRIVMGCGTWAGLSNRKMPPGCPLCNHVINEGQMYLNNRALDDPNFPFPELIDGVKALASVPLITQGEVLGALTVGYEQPIQNEDLHILSVISDIAASAIHRARLYEQTSSQAAELIEAYDATIEGWALALEMRDKETQGHSRRVTEQTLLLAAKMGLPESDMVHIRRGVLLHDIGKMGIPDSILLKPGPLTDDEWVVMHKHPEYAYKMLSSIRYLEPAMDIPLYHHERWDGTGYPLNLAGEAIPLFARIFSVVDVMDALTSARPYRPAWSRKEALDYIRENSGQRFDPNVVEVFLKMQAAYRTGPLSFDRI